LRNHGTAAHSKEKAVKNIGTSLRYTFSIAIATGTGYFVYQV
jgi:hypothetical protein